MLILGLLVSATGSLFLVRSVQPARAAGRDNPVGSLEVGQQSTTTSTAAPARQPVAQSGGPVDVPVDSYASEPVIQIGTIEIPKIGLVSPIFHGITLRNIDHGPSHWPGTAFPGETGNAVFAGHRVTHTHPFMHIDRLEAGDQVTFTVQGIRTVYVVTGHEVVSPKNLSIVAQTSTPTATLFACHPPHFATFRYVVHLALLAS